MIQITNLSNFEINAHNLNELEAMGISAEMIVDAIEALQSFEDARRQGNKEWAKRALDASYKSLIRIIRRMDYDLDLEQDIEDIVKAAKKYAGAMIEGDSFNIDFERIGFEYELTKFKIEHPDFEW